MCIRDRVPDPGERQVALRADALLEHVADAELGRREAGDRRTLEQAQRQLRVALVGRAVGGLGRQLVDGTGIAVLSRLAQAGTAEPGRQVADPGDELGLLGRCRRSRFSGCRSGGRGRSGDGSLGRGVAGGGLRDVYKRQT